MANRFYTPSPLSVGSIVLDGPEAHHLSHVRRLGIGDEALLFNGDGREYRAIVASIAKREVELNIIEVNASDREIGFRLQVACALPKGDRLDFLIEKLTELGATDFTPLLAERSIVVARESKIEKLQRAVIESSKQCGRNVLMNIHSPLRFVEWCGLDNLPESRWIAHPGGESIALRPIAKSGVAIAIGPEGGFTDQEVSAAMQAGFCRVSLGPRILRIETAALAAVTLFGCGQ